MSTPTVNSGLTMHGSTANYGHSANRYASPSAGSSAEGRELPSATMTFASTSPRIRVRRAGVIARFEPEVRVVKKVPISVLLERDEPNEDAS